MNVDGYYNSLLSFIDKAVDEGFVSPTARRIIVSAPTAKLLVRQLEVFFLILFSEPKIILPVSSSLESCFFHDVCFLTLSFEFDFHSVFRFQNVVFVVY